MEPAIAPLLPDLSSDDTLAQPAGDTTEGRHELVGSTGTRVWVVFVEECPRFKDGKANPAHHYQRFGSENSGTGRGLELPRK
jgi:hypothetical protein